MSNTITEKKIDLGNFKYKLLNAEDLKPNQIQGYNLSHELFSNIFLMARKKSGKTTCLYNMLLNFVGEYKGEKTIVYFFVSTLNKDNSYKQIIEELEKKGHPIESYTSFYDENGSNILEDIMNRYDEKKKLEKQLEEEKKQKKLQDNNENTILYGDYNIIIHDDDEDEVKVTVKKKKKKVAPYMIVVCDDISDELRTNKMFRKFLKNNRHYKSKTIISSQDIFDIYPDSRNMCDIAIFFKKIDHHKLISFFKGVQSNLNEQQFLKLYHHATDDNGRNEKRDFFYFDCNEGSYRKNFDTLLDIPQ